MGRRHALVPSRASVRRPRRHAALKGPEYLRNGSTHADSCMGRGARGVSSELYQGSMRLFEGLRGNRPYEVVKGYPVRGLSPWGRAR